MFDRAVSNVFSEIIYIRRTLTKRISAGDKRINSLRYADNTTLIGKNDDTIMINGKEKNSLGLVINVF